MEKLTDEQIEERAAEIDNYITYLLFRTGTKLTNCINVYTLANAIQRNIDYHRIPVDIDDIKGEEVITIKDAHEPKSIFMAKISIDNNGNVVKKLEFVDEADGLIVSQSRKSEDVQQSMEVQTDDILSHIFIPYEKINPLGRALALLEPLPEPEKKHRK